MELMKRIPALTMLIVCVWACNTPSEPKEATTYDFPSPIDTSTKPIEVQEKQVLFAKKLRI